jgi:hypothetical protein
LQSSPAKRIRRNLDWLTLDLLRAGHKANGQQDEHGVTYAAVVDVAAYVSSHEGVPNDRQLRNTVYGRLRNGRDWDKRTVDNGTKAGQAVFYVKGTASAATGAKITGGSGGTPRGHAASSPDGSHHGAASPRDGAAAPAVARAASGARLSSSSSSSSSSNSSRSAAAAAVPAARGLVGGVPHFGGAAGHRSFFHTEAVQRGVARANSTLARLGQVTGLTAALGDLDVEVLGNDTCDGARWATVLGWHDKYERMKSVFQGGKDGEVEGYRFTLVLNCRSGPPHARTCVPVSVASVTPHRVLNKQEGSSGGSSSGSSHWHVELELQTLLVPVEHQGKGIGTVMQRAM